MRATRTRHSWRSFWLGTKPGHVLMLIIVMSVLLAISTAAWMSVGDCSKETTRYPEACLELGRKSDWVESSYFAWGLFADPGTQTGLPPDAGFGNKLVVLLFSCSGFIFNLVVLGLVVEFLRTLLIRWKRLHRRVIANDHTIILGWTDKTLFLIEEQARLLAGSKDRGGTIAIMGELSTREMKEEVSVTFPDWSTKYPRVGLIYRQGKPYELDDLMRVSVRSAAAGLKWRLPTVTTAPHQSARLP